MKNVRAKIPTIPLCVQISIFFAPALVHDIHGVVTGMRSKDAHK